MEFCEHEVLLPNHFQKDRLRLINQSSLSKRRKPSKYYSGSYIKSEKINPHFFANCSSSSAQSAFKLDCNRRTVSESKLNVIDYSQSKLDDFKKCSTSDWRRNTVLIQTWERRSQYDSKKSQAFSNNRKNSHLPYRTCSSYCNKDNLIEELNKPKNMLDRPLQVVSTISTSKSDGNYVGRNGTAISQDSHNFRRMNGHQTKPRPKSMNVLIRDGSVSQEPEWISLSRKLCAKFVESHLDQNVSTRDMHNPENMLQNSHPKAIIPVKFEKKMDDFEKTYSKSTLELKSSKSAVESKNSKSTVESKSASVTVKSKMVEKPQWIDLSRKLCNKFIEEHIECEPCNVENQRISPFPVSTTEAPKTDVRIVEKLGRRIHAQERKHEEQPEWIILSRKLRAKFIEGHRDDPDTISLDNQLNASDLEEYGSDFKRHRNNQKSPPHPLAVSPCNTATDQLHKKGTAPNSRGHDDSSESSSNRPAKAFYCYWSDISPRENEFIKTSDDNLEHDQTPEWVSSKTPNLQEENDVNYELTFEEFETEPLEKDCDNGMKNVDSKSNIITPEPHLHPFEQDASGQKDKKSKSLCDLSSMYDCDSLEYCSTSGNGHLKTPNLTAQQNLNPAENGNDCDYLKEHSFSYNRFRISYPERDKNVSSLKSPVPDVSQKDKISNSATVSISSRIYPHETSQHSNSENHTITAQSTNSKRESINHEASREDISNNQYFNGGVQELRRTPHVTPMKDHASINNSNHMPTKDNSEYGILDETPMQEKCASGKDKITLIHHHSSNHQSDTHDTYHVGEFNSHDTNFITDISVEKTCDENFLPNSFDDSLKCKIKVPHCLKNEIKDTDLEFNTTVSKSELINPPLAALEKQQRKEAFKEKRTQKISDPDTEYISNEVVNGNSVLDYCSDQIAKKREILFDYAEYENVPKNLMQESGYSRKQSKSYYIDEKPVKFSRYDRSDEFVPDANSSYRPINPPLEFEMFDLPQICSPENQKILLSRSSAVKNMTTYGDGNQSVNRNFNSLKHTEFPKIESSDSETPNSTPFDARTLVSPSSYASDSETSSWTLTKNNSYAVNRSPIPDTDVSDCSLSVKCDYTPSCSNQSTMESRGSNSAGNNVCVSTNGHSADKIFKSAENRFTEVFVDCETSKNWKKSHSLDHLENKDSKACNSSFYINLHENSIRSAEDLPKSKENDNMDAMPESLRHLFNTPMNNPTYTPAAKTSMLLSKTAEPPPCHYYSVTSDMSSVKESKSFKKSKKSDRSSSLKIKDIAQGIILSFRKFHSHSKSSHVSSSHYVDVSHLAENHVNNGNTNSQKNLPCSSQTKYIQEMPATYGKINSNKMFSGGYFGHRSTSESNLYLPTNTSKQCTCDNLIPSTNHREVDERSKSFNFGKLTDMKSSKQHKKPHETKEKKNKNHSNGKNKNKKLEPKATSSVSRKVQQMADGTLCLVTTVSGDTAVPGVYSESPDTGSEISSHGPVKLRGESHC